MIKKFPFLEPQSKSPGVILYQADFKHFGNNRVPFAGGKFHLDVGSISKPDTHDFFRMLDDYSRKWYIKL